MSGNLWISEAADMVPGSDGSLMPLWPEPSLGTQKIAAFTTAAQSSTFRSDTRFIRFYCDIDCNIAFGSNPTATATSPRYAAGVEYFRVLKVQGLKLSVYDGTS